MICLGIDPDTKNTGLALVEHHPGTSTSPSVLWVGTAEVDATRGVEKRVRCPHFSLCDRLE